MFHSAGNEANETKLILKSWNTGTESVFLMGFWRLKDQVILTLQSCAWRKKIPNDAFSLFDPSEKGPGSIQSCHIDFVWPDCSFKLFGLIIWVRFFSPCAHLYKPLHPSPIKKSLLASWPVMNVNGIIFPKNEFQVSLLSPFPAFRLSHHLPSR